MFVEVCACGVVERVISVCRGMCIWYCRKSEQCLHRYVRVLLPEELSMFIEVCECGNVERVNSD